MAKATKLPSGNWRVLAYANGHRKSFTAPTKKEAEYQASQWLMEETDYEDMTVQKAIERFIDNRENITSPSTIRGYKAILKNDYSDWILKTKVSKVTSEDIQKEVNDFAKNHSPKTVRNVYGLLRSSILAVNPNKGINVRLPQKKTIERRIPTADEIKQVLNNADSELRIAIMLASMGTMRIGEICALEYKDIDGNIIHVHRAMVYTDKSNYIIRDIPKNTQSDRYITYPTEVIKEIGTGDGRIISSNTRALSSRYRRLIQRMGIDMSLKFHDLRHYAASAMHAMGIPDQYIMAVGGWSSDSILKSVYRNTLDDERKKFEEMRNSKMKDYFF